jgi:membrane-associated PAP2 superfamily phosphatase
MSLTDHRASRIGADSCSALPLARRVAAGWPWFARGAASWRDTRVTLVALMLLVVWEVTAWDRPVAHWFGNASGFVLRDAWITRALMHEGGRWLAGLVLALFVLDAVRPVLAGPSRRERWYWLGMTIAAWVIVPGFKQLSHTSCPWDLLEFGGHIAYVPHWVFSVSDGGPGHCFPSGHAVAAFAFLTLYFLWRPYRPVLARWMLGGVIAMGALFGWAQMARGAHFPSHTFWSAWLCWALCVAADALAHRRRRRRDAVMAQVAGMQAAS